MTGHGPSGPCECVLFHATGYGVSAVTRVTNKETSDAIVKLRIFAAAVKEISGHNSNRDDYRGDSGVSTEITSTRDGLNEERGKWSPT